MRDIVRLAVVVGVLLPLPALAQTANPPQIGVSGIRLASFSPQRAFAESDEGKAGLARLTALQEKRAREVEERNTALQAREQALTQSLARLSNAVRSQRTKELEKFRLDTQRFIQDAQAEWAGAQRDVEDAFAAKVAPALDLVARRIGVQLVVNLDDPVIVWADPVIDITADVVKQLALAAR